MKRIVLLLLFWCCVPLNSFAASDQLSQNLYDAVHFAANGNDVVIELAFIEKSLSNGADPNWIRTWRNSNADPVFGNYSCSILFNFVEIISYCSKDSICEKRGFEAINLLFKFGAKIQSSDIKQLLLLSPINRGHHEIVELLLENGASATSYSTGATTTPMETAVASGNKKIIELLASYGAPKLEPSAALQTRLISIAGSGSLDDLKTIILAGAAINGSNRQGETALIAALDFIPYDDDQYAKIMYLLNHGADVNLRDRDGTTPLHKLIGRTRYVYKDASENKANDRVSSAINNAGSIFKELLKKGAFVSAQDSDGRTPLHIAANYNHLFAARILLAAGAKVMPKDKANRAPLDYAESASMIQLLKKYGAQE